MVIYLFSVAGQVYTWGTDNKETGIILKIFFF
jgi:hypothetical protein